MSASQAATVSETHVSVLFCVGDRAYKLKKAVRLPFLDFSQREQRLAVCRREVELNRRLAPDVYLGVADVVGPDGGLADHLVVMRRMPGERRLTTLVRAGADVDAALRAVAHRVAAFHLAAATSDEIAAAAAPAAVEAMWTRNLDEIRRFAGAPLDGDALEHAGRLGRRYLAGRGLLLDRRIAQGWARDGHGDLLADDIFCLDDGPRILDCIEFDDRLRHGDVLLDAAFLAMDLERLGRPDLAARFLADWQSATGEHHPATLADVYVAYRALVRSKVACHRHEQGDAGAAAEARALLGIAVAHLERARVRLTLVGGLPGTGKSTVAAAIAAATGWVLLRSDEVRREITGADAPRYDPEARREVYAEMVRRAERLLRLGEPVVLDATWLDPAMRARAAAAADAASADLRAVRCDVPLEVAAERLRSRAAAGTDVSDATPQVLGSLAAASAPWPEAETVDTSGSTGTAVATALAALAAPTGAPPSPTISREVPVP